ncbi:LysM peptidoglycan-binding domain-containing protein [Jeotgalibacillus sp. ET6]|uniref:LysM peptidoglycan-binding domain-containing protein n=1 Tax=Jeotgalibacillus sp. ET6 TaxID=3037260 RepID=UPI002418B20F|nr:LysM peptidoglycan-binding domain-containing protein [Jeotgalibacillus sp. ET6]MDG5472047.1 LysM peptidoglycan-binding domain-containing protein [Jeotgalibacillus sp. ET6]
MPIMDNTFFVYTVQPGDTLTSIAYRFSSSVSAIEQANALYPPITDPGLIFPGQRVVVEKNGPAVIYRIVHGGDTLYQFAQDYSSAVDVIYGINPQIGNPDLLYVNQPVFVPAFIYRVEEGDTLAKIAKQFGIPLSALFSANLNRPGWSPDVIYPGYDLLIPLSSSRNILVTSPRPGTTVAAGQTLSGFARAFEGSILYQLKDSSGGMVTGESPIQASAGGPLYGTFSIPIQFERSPQTSAGELWVYARSAEDGRIIDLVKIPVMF